jgi:hypothetical protein
MLLFRPKASPFFERERCDGRDSQWDPAPVQKQETFRFFKGDADLPPRVIMLDGSGSITFDVLAWLGRGKAAGRRAADTPAKARGDQRGFRPDVRGIGVRQAVEL